MSVGKRAHIRNTSAAQDLSMHNKSQITLFLSVEVYMDLILQNPNVSIQPFTAVNKEAPNLDNPFVGNVYLVHCFK